MKKYLLLFLIFIFTILNLLAQTDTAKVKVPSPWKLTGSTSLNFVQSSFTNWSSGGDNSVAGTAFGKLGLVYKKDKINWESTLDLAYGLTFVGSDRRKNDDKIDFASKFGYKAFKYWDYSGLVTFKSQFDKGYAKYPVEDKAKYNSKFFAPAYLTLSIGMDYKPNNNFSLLISPLSAKLTFVNDDYLSEQGAFGVDKGERLLAAYGALIRSTYSKKFNDVITTSSKLELFSNLLDSPEKVAINWEGKVILTVTKFIKANLDMQLMYDDKVKYYAADKSLESGAKVQFKQVLGIGFSFAF